MTAPIRQQVRLPQLLARGRGGVTVVSLRGELDLLGVPTLQACLSDIRWRGRPRCVVDLSGLVFIDCACLGVLARYSQEIRARGGSFALAGPQGTVRRVLSVTGLITWFQVHDTVGQAVAGGRQPLVLAADPGRSRIRGKVRRFGPGPVLSAIGSVLPEGVRRDDVPTSSPARSTTFLELSSTLPSAPGKRRHDRGAAAPASALEHSSPL